MQTAAYNYFMKNRPEGLIDFHLRWAEFRDEAIAARDSQNLSDETRETVGWLISIADRITAVDLIERRHEN